MITSPFMAPRRAPPTIAGADFNGSGSTFVRRLTALSGIPVTAHRFAFSFWYRLDGGNGSQMRALSQATAVGTASNRGGPITRSAAHNWVVSGIDGAGNVVVQWSTASGLIRADGRLHHVCGSYFARTVGVVQSAYRLYVDDRSDAVPTTLWSGPAFPQFSDAAVTTVGAGGDGSQLLNGVIFDFWYAVDRYIDFGEEHNRRRFISSQRKRVDLGPDGSRTTGFVPTIFLHLAERDSLNETQINRGGGGNFSISGGLGRVLLPGNIRAGDVL